MKQTVIKRAGALLLAAVLALTSVPAALAADGSDQSAYATAAAEDIYVSPPDSHRDGLLKFDDAVKNSTSSIRGLLNDACLALSERLEGTAYPLDYISYISLSPLQGTLYDGYNSEGDPGIGVAGLARYYYSDPNANYKIADIQFVPNTSFSGQALMTYYGYYTYTRTEDGRTVTGQRSYSGRLYISVGKQEPGISYATDGEAVRFSGEDFASYSLAVTGRTFRYISFSLPESSKGKLYYNYLDEAIYDAEVTTGARYYRSTNPTVSNVYFVPKPDYAGSFTLSFTGADIAGTEVNGFITITVTDYGPDHAGETAVGAFTYSVKSGRSVTLDPAEFRDQTQSKLGVSFSYFRFGALPPSSGGTLYNDGATSNTYRFVDVDRDYSSPANIRFTANSGFTGTVSVPIVVHGGSGSGNWFDATLRFVVTDGGDAPLRYTVDPGSRVSLQLADFVDACYNATGYDLYRIHIDSLPPSSKGTLYYNGSTSVSTSSSSSYYKSSTPRIENLSFLAGSDFTGSLTIPFTGYASGYTSSNGRSFSGIITIASADAGETEETTQPIGSTAGGLTYYTTGPAVALNLYDLRNSAASALPAAPTTVVLTRPDENAGQLCFDFSSLSRYSAFNYRQSYPVEDIPRVSFLPKAGFNGTTRINYTLSDARGNSFTGNIYFVVTPPTRSRYFTDMGAASWAVPAVDFFRYYGATNGNSSTGFGPAVEMRRGDFILLLSRSFSFPNAGTASFADVPVDKYYAAAIASARSLGVLTGSASDNFYPEAGITRQDAALYLYRALRRAQSLTPGTAADLSAYRDASDVSSYAVEAMGALVRLGVFQGDYGRLYPTTILNRAEALKILYYALT